jgi:hypothetical protein
LLVLGVQNLAYVHNTLNELSESMLHIEEATLRGQLVFYLAL